MKNFLSTFLIGMTVTLSAQTVPSLPVPIGAGTAEVWRDTLYFFGGSSTWGGRDQLYQRVYKFDGLAWSYQDSIPDNNVWDVESVLVRNEAYLVGGWRSGATFLRKYDLTNGAWTYLSPSPNTSSWGITVEQVNGFIYLFNANGNVFEYDVANNVWRAKTSNATLGYLALNSVVFQDEIYITGFYNSGFYKYSPAADHWTPLANTPYPTAACAMGVINGKIYCVGGSEQGNNYNTHQTILAYDIGTNSWSVDQLQISGRRTWMAAAAYQGGFYIIGGIDSTGSAVNIVEKIVPQGPVTGVAEKDLAPAAFSLGQNYPNPFNPSTTIPYALAQSGPVQLSIHDMIGRHVRTLINAWKTAGTYAAVWDGRDDAGRAVTSGSYFCKLSAGEFVQQRRLALIK